MTNVLIRKLIKKESECLITFQQRILRNQNVDKRSDIKINKKRIRTFKNVLTKNNKKSEYWQMFRYESQKIIRNQNVNKHSDTKIKKKRIRTFKNVLTKNNKKSEHWQMFWYKN